MTYQRTIFASGTATLVDGIVTVYTSQITSTRKLFFNHIVPLGDISILFPENVVDGVSFDICSASPTDQSTVAWMIVETR